MYICYVMGITAYRSNSDARYAAGAVGTSKEGLVVALTQSSIQVQSGATSLGYIDSASVLSTGGAAGRLGIFSDLKNCSNGSLTVLNYRTILI